MGQFVCEVRIARHAIYNILGHAGPLIVAFFAIPVIVSQIGTERFGLLHYAWMVVGCFSLFDLGIGRILTRLVANKMGEGQEHAISDLVWTSLTLLFFLGIVMALIGAVITPYLVRDVLKVPMAMEEETIDVFFLLCLSLPVIISTAGIRGVLEAYKHFGITSSIRIAVGLFTFLGPLVTLFFTNSLLIIVEVLVTGRIIGLVVHLIACLIVVDLISEKIFFARKEANSIFAFGGWMTVTNIINLVIAYFDRFLIGAFVSVAAVAYYATPYEMVTNFLIIPGSIIKVIFPTLTSSFVQNRNCTVPLFFNGVKYIFLIIFPITAFFVAFAYEGLELWLGYEFAQNSTTVLQWLAIGVFLNSLLQVPFALIQSAGRPDITAKLNVIELPVYIYAMWFMIKDYGIWGASVVWFSRQIIDCFILYFLAKKVLQNDFSLIQRVIIPVGSAVVYLFFVAFLVDTFLKGLFVFFPLIAGAPIIWYLVLSREERIAVWSYIKLIP